MLNDEYINEILPFLCRINKCSSLIRKNNVEHIIVQMGIRIYIRDIYEVDAICCRLRCWICSPRGKLSPMFGHWPTFIWINQYLRNDSLLFIIHSYDNIILIGAGRDDGVCMILSLLGNLYNMFYVVVVINCFWDRESFSPFKFCSDFWALYLDFHNLSSCMFYVDCIDVHNFCYIKS